MCGDWAVRDVVGHLIHQYRIYRAPYRLIGLVRYGFRVNRYLSGEACRLVAGRPIDELISDLEAAEFEQTRIWKRFTSPIFALSELGIHAQDIRRPLGISEKPGIAQLKITVDNIVRPQRGNPFVRIFLPKLPDTRFEATDSDWASGDGPIARGTLEAIAMVLSGRGQALGELSGEGVDRLRAKLSA